MTPITYEWLRSRGFRLDSGHVDSKPRMVRVSDRRAEIALEVAESNYPRPGFTVWLRSDLAGSRSRFVFARRVETTDQMERLWNGLTDEALTEVEWDRAQFAEALAMETLDCERRYHEYAKGNRYGHVPG